MTKSNLQLQILQIKSRSLPGEKWMLAYPGYALSNMGRWYSIHSKKIMRQNKNSSGYKRCTIMLNGQRKHILTHIKVVEIYGDCKGCRIPQGATSLRELGISIDHVDCKRTNPRQSNLEIVTHRENCRRREINKTNKQNKQAIKEEKEHGKN